MSMEGGKHNTHTSNNKCVNKHVFKKSKRRGKRRNRRKKKRKERENSAPNKREETAIGRRSFLFHKAHVVALGDTVEQPTPPQLVALLTSVQTVLRDRVGERKNETKNIMNDTSPQQNDATSGKNKKKQPQRPTPPQLFALLTNVQAV